MGRSINWGEVLSTDESTYVECDEAESTDLSDDGSAVKTMIDIVDELEKTQSKLEKSARDAVEHNIPSTLSTFNLILKNGNDKETSIWQLMTESKRRMRGRLRKRNITKTFVHCSDSSELMTRVKEAKIGER